MHAERDQPAKPRSFNFCISLRVPYAVTMPDLRGSSFPPIWGSDYQTAAQRQTSRHPVMSGCREAPVACAARERHVTVARNDDRVRNLAGFGGLGGAPAALVGHPGERSVARPTAASMRSVSGRRSTARGAGTGRNAADGPGRRAIVPTAPQRGDRARLPLSSVQQVGCGK
jgi:hypothetical protein